MLAEHEYHPHVDRYRRYRMLYFIDRFGCICVCAVQICIDRYPRRCYTVTINILTILCLGVWIGWAVNVSDEFHMRV